VLFIEPRFFLFFLAVFGVHWLLAPWHRSRKLWLLAASWTFYAAWDWRFLGLILLSTIVDLVAGARIHASDDERVRRRWLAFSLTSNLGLLGFFKYFDFFASSATTFFAFLGLEVGDWTLKLVLPVGISFYTFQTISYSLDIFRRRLEPVRNPLDLALFVAFFPQLVAGPIVRAVQFLPQLRTNPRWKDVAVRASLTVFLFGYIKKTCISDRVSPLVEQAFADPGAFDGMSLWLGAVLFHVQLYCDFSGYSDMAIGLAGLLGYQLPKNFDFPYFTRSMSSFWRHWHITLGRFFSDYLYIPLGGSRGSLARTRWNIFLVMFISGLWHGAAWPMVLWGVVHGLWMVAERGGLGERVERSPALFGVLWVNFAWCTSMPLFRSQTTDQAFAYLGGMFAPLGRDAATSSLPASWFLFVASLFVVHGLNRSLGLAARWERLPKPLWAVSFGAFVALVLPWVVTEGAPFIYFQF